MLSLHSPTMGSHRDAGQSHRAPAVQRPGTANTCRQSAPGSGENPNKCTYPATHEARDLAKTEGTPATGTLLQPKAPTKSKKMTEPLDREDESDCIGVTLDQH